MKQRYIIILAILLAFLTYNGTSIASEQLQSSLIVYTKSGDDAGLYVKQPETQQQRLISKDTIDFPQWSPTGARMFAVLREYVGWNPVPRMIVLSSDGEKKTLNIPFTTNISWSPDGRFFTYEAGSAFGRTINVYKAEIETGEVTQLTSDGISYDPAWSPDGKYIAFARFEKKDIVVMEPDGGNIRSLTTGSVPDWSSDGKKIAFFC